MMNFLFGTVAGGVIACVVTIAAARHPEVQSRLGLIPSAQAALTPVPHVPEPCIQARPERSEARAERADKLFEPRRFWFVAP